MKRMNLLFAIGIFTNLLTACGPGENKNAEDYGSRPEAKTVPAPALNDIAASGQKVIQAPAQTPTPASTETKNTATAKAQPGQTPQTPKQPAIDGKALMAKSDCFACHQEQAQLVGPSYAAVAKKYAPTDANIAMLAEKIKKGGSGVWGAVPMSPHPAFSDDELKAIARYVLSVK